MTSYHTDHLFPLPILRGFTTSQSPLLGNSTNLKRVPLDDKALKVVKVSKGTTRDIVDVPSGSDTIPAVKAWKAVYPKGSINPSSAIRGGFGFYIDGPPDFGWDQAREVVMSYAVLFEPGFDFQLGGKLPGPYGGATPELAYGCSGGRSEDRDKAFSLRLMWRAGGKGEVYGYLPLGLENDKALLEVPPMSERNPDFGFSIGRGAWTFVPGEWCVIAIRVKLNDLGEANGEVQVFANGTSVLHARGVVIREKGETVVRGVHFQTFFGGQSAQWASPKDQHAYFSAISGAVIA